MDGDDLAHSKVKIPKLGRLYNTNSSLNLPKAADKEPINIVSANNGSSQESFRLKKIQIKATSNFTKRFQDEVEETPRKYKSATFKKKFSNVLVSMPSNKKNNLAFFTKPSNLVLHHTVALP